jgi:hypothetical protein
MVDASIPLQTQTPKPIDPMEQYGRVAALQGALLGQQVDQARLTGLNQENQMRQIQIDQTQKMNDIYRNAFTNPTDGSAPQFDANKFQRDMANAGIGSRIPEAMQKYTEFQKSLTDLANSKAQLAERQTDTAGMLGLERFDQKLERARILAAGALIIQVAMEYLHINEVQVSSQGVREGALLAWTRYGDGWLEEVNRIASERQASPDILQE